MGNWVCDLPHAEHKVCEEQGVELGKPRFWANLLPILTLSSFLQPETESRGHDQAHFKAWHIWKNRHGTEWFPNRIFLPKIHLAVQLFTLYSALMLPIPDMPASLWWVKCLLGEHNLDCFRTSFPMLGDSQTLTQHWLCGMQQVFREHMWTGKLLCSSVTQVVSSALNTESSSLCFYLLKNSYCVFRKWISVYLYFPIFAMNEFLENKTQTIVIFRLGIKQWVPWQSLAGS